MNHRQLRSWSAALGGPAMSAANAWGQSHGEAEDAQLRNDCRLATQILVTGEPRPHYAWAFSFISLCDRGGPTALSRLGADRTSDSDTTRLESLGFQSQRLREARLVQPLVATLSDATRPHTVRVASLPVLISQVAPLHDAAPEYLVDRGGRASDPAVRAAALCAAAGMANYLAAHP